MGNILVLLIVGIILYFVLFRNKQTKESNIGNIKKDKGHEDELTRVEREVEKRKEKARDCELPRVFTNLYHDNIKYYPSWIRNEHNRNRISSLVTDAVELEDKRIKITLKGKDYIFSFMQDGFDTPDGEWHTRGKLELYFDNKQILKFTMFEEDKEYYKEWKACSDVDAFVDGDWVSDFRELAQRIPYEKEEREQENKEKEKPEKIKKLKNDFGID